MRRALSPRRLAALVVVSLLAAASLEALLRLSGYRPPLSDRRLFVAGADDLLPYRLRPGYRGMHIGRPVTIDAQGERAVRPRVAPPGGAPRETVLLVGDSIVFGHGLADADTLASQLTAALARRGLTWEVRNIGVPGYTSWNEYAAVRAFFARSTASFVVVVYVPNDATFDNDHLRLREGRYGVRADGLFHRATNWLYHHSHAAYALADAAKKTWWRSGDGAATSGRESYLDEAAIEYSMRALVRLREECDRHGARLLIGVYRDLWHYDDPGTSSLYESRVTTALERHGLRWFGLRSHVAHLPLDRARLRWNDPHPSAEAVAWMVHDTLAALWKDRAARADRTG